MGLGPAAPLSGLNSSLQDGAGCTSLSATARLVALVQAVLTNGSRGEASRKHDGVWSRGKCRRPFKNKEPRPLSCSVTGGGWAPGVLPTSLAFRLPLKAASSSEAESLGPTRGPNAWEEEVSRGNEQSAPPPLFLGPSAPSMRIKGPRGHCDKGDTVTVFPMSTASNADGEKQQPCPEVPRPRGESEAVSATQASARGGA